MDDSNEFLKDMHEDQGQEKIDKLKKKIDTTQYNIEVSESIIDETPHEAESVRLKEKNTARKHAIGSMEKEIRDIEQTIEQRRPAMRSQAKKE